MKLKGAFSKFFVINSSVIMIFIISVGIIGCDNSGGNANQTVTSNEQNYTFGTAVFDESKYE